MGPQPLISVCIPAYNNEGFIACTLESVLKQTYRNFEVIIRDDKSADATVSVIKRFADPRIKLIQNDTNLGLGQNWNKTVSFASGKYIKLLCGDDVIYPECLGRQAEILEKPANSRVALALCNSDVIDAGSKVILRRKSRCGSGQVSGNKLIRNCVRWGTNLIGEPAVGLFRRDMLAGTPMFDPVNPYLIDLAFWAELLKQGDAFIDQDRLAAFRISGGSVSTKVGLKQARCFRSFIRKIRHDPAYRTSHLDVATGCILSLQWCILRNLLISFRAR